MMQESRANSYLFGGNAPYVEELYEAYLDNPGSVPDKWRSYFDALQNVPATDGTTARDMAHAPVVESFAQRAKANAFGNRASSEDLAIARKQVYVQSLIAAYRSLGSRWADLDPLKRQERPKIPELEPAFYDLSEADMDMVFSATNTYFTTDEQMTLRQIVQALRETYCGTIGAEYMHCTEPTEKRWWQQRLESIRAKPTLSREEKTHILERLTAPENLPSGDVKYHQGFSSDITTPGGPVHLSLSFNPSHLEIVNPVVEGSVRARQRRRDDKTGDQVLPILVHGDAAFAGQGVVMETLNLSGTRGYGTGGTVHLIVNNQIGFTTSDPRDARSTLYCTDVAKMVEAPIFHVNGDDPEAVLFVTQLALDFRAKFHKDVVIDIVCFRKLGHNEQDEPFVTQPLMYKKIAQHPGTRKLYADKLEKEGVIKAGEADDMVTSVRAALDAGKPTNPKILYGLKPALAIDWAPYMNVKWRQAAETAVPMPKLK